MGQTLKVAVTAFTVGVAYIIGWRVGEAVYDKIEEKIESKKQD